MTTALQAALEEAKGHPKEKKLIHGKKTGVAISKHDGKTEYKPGKCALRQVG